MVPLAGRTDGFERSLQEADSIFEESLHQEQKGDCATALVLCNEAISKLRLTMHDASSSTQSRVLVDKKLQIYVRKERSLQDRLQQQQPVQPPPTCHPPPGGHMTQSTSKQAVPFQVLLSQKIVLEPIKDAEFGSSSHIHPLASHLEKQSSYSKSFLQSFPESSLSQKTYLNCQDLSADFTEQATSFPCRHAMSDRSIQIKNELSDDMKDACPKTLKDCEVYNSSSKLKKPHHVATPLTPYCKMKLHNGSLPTLFPSSQPLEVLPSKKDLCNPHFNAAAISEWSSVAEPVTALPFLSPMPRDSPETLQSPVQLRVNSHESLHHPQEQLVKGDSWKSSEYISSKGRVFSVANQHQWLEGEFQKQGSYKEERKPVGCHDQNTPKLQQESNSSPFFLHCRQSALGGQESGIQPAEMLNSCLSRTELSSEDCFSVSSIISKSPGSHNQVLCNKGKQRLLNPKLYPGKCSYEEEIREANSRNPAGLVASVPVDSWVANVKNHCNSQHHYKNASWFLIPGSKSSVISQVAFGEEPMKKYPTQNQNTEQESLYQSGKQAPQTSNSILGILDSAQQALDNTANQPTRKMHNAAYTGLSKVEEYEHNSCRNIGSSVPKIATHVPYVKNHGREPEEEIYSAENLRRIAQNLSGTVITNKEEMPVASHSFEASNERKMSAEAGRNSFSTTSLSFPHNSPTVLPFSPQHYSTQLQQHSHDAPVPGMAGKTHRESENQKLPAVPDRTAAFKTEDSPRGALSHGNLIYKQDLPFEGQKSPLNTLLESGASNTSSHRLQRSHTGRKIATFTDGETMHWEYTPEINSSSQEHLPQWPFPQGKDKASTLNWRPSLGGGYRTVSHNPSTDKGGFQSCLLTSQQTKVQAPRRVDMPPDEDWRQHTFTLQSGARRILPARMMDGISSEMHWKSLAHATVASMHSHDW